MFRTGPQVSAQDKLEKQKQKKRLSFRDPEIEGPQRQSGFSALSTAPAKGFSRRGSSSVEDLSLEDQALHVAQSVGNAFSGLSFKGPTQSQYSDKTSFNSDPGSQEASNKGCSSSEYVSYQRRCQQRNFKISQDDQDYLSTGNSHLLDEAMRCPSVETMEASPPKNSFLEEERFPTGAQHQIQLLKYQLDQQSQQTQMALHQVQLLTDQAEAESNARRKAQEQNNLLMIQNKELLDHMGMLFQQIEELERQIRMLEQEKKSSRIAPESQVVHRPTPSYTGYRRLSADQTVQEKQPSSPNRSQIKKNPLTSAKPTVPLSKAATSQNVGSNRRSSLTSPRQYSTQAKTASSLVSPRQYSAQTKSAESGALAPQRPYSTQTKSADSSTMPSQKLYSTQTKQTDSSAHAPQRPFSTQTKHSDSNNKGNEVLRIGDTSPPVQSGTMTPFGSGWKLSSSTATEKTVGMLPRSRTGSFSSFGKLKTQDETTTKSSLFNNNSTFSSNTSSKKYSSSTSDLYNNSTSYQMNKSLVIDEPPSNPKSAISNLNLSPPSKLPRFQAFSAFRRKSSLSSDSEQFSQETYKNAAESSLFNR